MTEATNTKLMDTEPGGEQTQYEGETSVIDNLERPGRDNGTFSDPSSNRPTDAESQAAKAKHARGDKTAQNIRYGEAISEHGFGGETVGNSGSANNGDGFGGAGGEYGGKGKSEGVGGESVEGIKGRLNEAKEGEGALEREQGEGEAGEARRKQGYGEGSGVGA